MRTLEYRPIGIIHSPHKELAGMPIQSAGAAGVEGWVKIDPSFEEGLKDLEGFSHIILLYHFHKAGQVRLRVTPFLDSQLRGVFATRAPARPNPIGISIVELNAVEGNRLEISNVDILDETPLLDIKPFIPESDRIEEVRIGWLSSGGREMRRRRSDDRFDGESESSSA